MFTGIFPKTSVPILISPSSHFFHLFFSPYLFKISFIKSRDGFLLKPRQGQDCLRHGFCGTELQQMLTILKIPATLFSCARVSNDFFLYLFTFPPFISLQTVVKTCNQRAAEQTPGNSATVTTGTAAVLLV